MDILLMILTAVLTGALFTGFVPRQGIGWWIGDQISAWFGAGFGFYMVYTVAFSKPLDWYLLWVVLGSAAGAAFMLSFSSLLLGREVEQYEPFVVDADEVIPDVHDYEEFEQVHEVPLRRAA